MAGALSAALATGRTGDRAHGTEPWEWEVGEGVGGDPEAAEAKDISAFPTARHSEMEFVN